MVIKLKKDISSPLVSIPAGTINEMAWFNHMLGFNVNELMPETKNLWFEPHHVDFLEEDFNSFHITLRTKVNLKEQAYELLYKLVHETEVNERNIRGDQ